jgi:alkylmercury lyase
MNTTHDLDALVGALAAADIPPRLAPAEWRLALAVLQQVADGHAVSPEHVARLAHEVSLPLDVAADVLGQVGEFDADGNLIGVIGLSLGQHPHRIRLGDHTLTTWCAWDTLFLPVLLEQTAQIETACPVRGEPIRLTVTPTGVQRCEPHGAGLALRVPEPIPAHPSSAQERWARFCLHVWFLSSRDVATAWLSQKHGDWVLLSVEDGYQLGRQVFGPCLRAAEEAPGVAASRERGSA